MKYKLTLITVIFHCFIFAVQGQRSIIDTIPIDFHIRLHDIETVCVTNNFDKKVMQMLGGSANGLLGRISGVSFSGSMVSFRGLNPRYSNITLDGLAAPITEQTIKAYKLGLLPSTAVQGLSINKSGYFSDQGEWGGALINISTNAEVSRNYHNFSFGTGYQHNFTFKDFICDQDHESKFGDVLGYGVDRRSFTRDIVNRETLQAMSRNESAAEGAKMDNRWGLETRTAIPNLNIGYSMGRILLQDGTRKLSTINSISYGRGQGGSHFLRAKYTSYEFEGNKAVGSSLQSYSTDGIFSTNSSLKINSGWNYIANSKHSYNLNLSYSHLGNFKTTSKYYIGLENNKEGYFARYSLLAKGVFLARLTGGNHFTEKLDLKWALGYGISSRNEPDQRNSAAQRNLDAPEDPFLLVIPESSKADLGSRFHSEMTDYSYSARFDLNYHLLEDRLKLKGGFLTETNDREFAARLITTVKDEFTSADLRFVDMSELATAFASKNYGSEGYYLSDATTDYDSYDADNLLLSGYIGGQYSFFQKWKTSLGLRFESFEQNLVSGDIDINNTSSDVLPFVNVAFKPNNYTVFKAAFSKSVNRPAFRELAPFIFYDFDYRADIEGNENLDNASLSNLDFSFLYLFGDNEYLNIGAFYKWIEKPIEMIYIIRSDSPLFTFDNANEAELGGVEVEFSKRLSSAKQSYLYNLLFVGSFSYTNSAIQLGEATNEVATSRPLQGQVPLLFSGALSYLTPKMNSQFSLEYRYVGKSLFSVGDGVNTFPWYNAPVHLLGAGFAYTFANNIKLKLSASNLLNTRFSQIEDTNFNGNISDSVDKEVSRGLTYQSYNLSVSYKF